MVITIKRCNPYPDIIRKYKIFIDDIYRGDIKKDEIKEFEVENGTHNVYAKIDWCRSNKIDTKCNDDFIKLEVGSPMIGWKMILAPIYITFLKNSYLWIREV